MSLSESFQYLESDEALQSIAGNVYWPKWNAPWWHVTLMHEMGLARSVPARVIRALTDRLKSSRLTVFPIHDHEVPAGVDAAMEGHCHCALGNIYQALAAAGVDVDAELPWIRPWFLRYQLPDGGLNCDEGAYFKNPPPSSMVATIAPLEAVLFHTSRPFTPEEERFLDQGARCLLARQLCHASTNPHNAEEKGDESDWMDPCFPRFYLYDILRGLNFVLAWADRRGQTLLRGELEPAVRRLAALESNGQLRVARQAFEGVRTRLPGDWTQRGPATFFPLLEQVSRVGEISPILSKHWIEAKRLMTDLKQRGLLI